MSSYCTFVFFLFFFCILSLEMKSGCSLCMCFSWKLCNEGLGRDRGLGWRLGDLGWVLSLFIEKCHLRSWINLSFSSYLSGATLFDWNRKHPLMIFKMIENLIIHRCFKCLVVLFIRNPLLISE